jgi:hypothetical protein
MALAPWFLSVALAKPVAAWVDSGEVASHPASDFVCGVGSGPTTDQADGSADASVARNVASEVTSVVATRVSRDGGQAERSVTSETLVHSTFAHAELFRWVSEDRFKGTFYVLKCLSRAEGARAVLGPSGVTELARWEARRVEAQAARDRGDSEGFARSAAEARRVWAKVEEAVWAASSLDPSGEAAAALSRHRAMALDVEGWLASQRVTVVPSASAPYAPAVAQSLRGAVEQTLAGVGVAVVGACSPGGWSVDVRIEGEVPWRSTGFLAVPRWVVGLRPCDASVGLHHGELLRGQIAVLEQQSAARAVERAEAQLRVWDAGPSLRAWLSTIWPIRTP